MTCMFSSLPKVEFVRKFKLCFVPVLFDEIDQGLGVCNLSINIHRKQVLVILLFTYFPVKTIVHALTLSLFATGLTYFFEDSWKTLQKYTVNVVLMSYKFLHCPVPGSSFMNSIRRHQDGCRPVHVIVFLKERSNILVVEFHLIN